MQVKRGGRIRQRGHDVALQFHRAVAEGGEEPRVQADGRPPPRRRNALAAARIEHAERRAPVGRDGEARGGEARHLLGKLAQFRPFRFARQPGGQCRRVLAEIDLVAVRTDRCIEDMDQQQPQVFAGRRRRLVSRLDSHRRRADLAPPDTPGRRPQGQADLAEDRMVQQHVGGWPRSRLTCTCGRQVRKDVHEQKTRSGRRCSNDASASWQPSSHMGPGRESRTHRPNAPADQARSTPPRGGSAAPVCRQEPQTQTGPGVSTRPRGDSQQETQMRLCLD